MHRDELLVGHDGHGDNAKYVPLVIIDDNGEDFIHFLRIGHPNGNPAREAPVQAL
ncbi:MAG: hypothetical protein PVJ53_15110 [Desulfobacterales bacterium]